MIRHSPPARPARSAPEHILRALDQRLLTIATVLLDDPTAPTDDPGSASTHLVPRLVDAVLRSSGRAEQWLLLTAVHAAYPDSATLLSFRRFCELNPPHYVESWLFERALQRVGARQAALPVRLVRDSVVVDVDFSARHDTHTGIHRVVRETLPRWDREHDLVAAAWTPSARALRTLDQDEWQRVFTFDRDVPRRPTWPDPELVVPWNSDVLLMDVPTDRPAPVLAALAEHSNNRVSLLGYDMIPVTSADLRPIVDANVFTQHLTVVKHATRVAAISRSAMTEYSGFVHALSAQGLPGPTVAEVTLTEDVPTPQTPPSPRGPRPVVVCPGSREPHKNHRAVLHAAERLWREGLDFEVRLVGGAGWTDVVLSAAAAELERRGRPLRQLGRVSDERLWTELRDADVVVFASLHEGYGLPVAEALALGTPVITSGFGSQREIGESGGCLFVDPHDDTSIADAMRQVLTDDALRERLRAEAAARPHRSWDEFATELWAFLVDGRPIAVERESE